ncbi:Elongator complex protein 2 [Strongyloides ratti]|uniref:Elongator complex protein 2 n=1 Tax=Strongyloides ratti TaxID=34506 RepID=A0A090LD97_STRRB|nr:Elongator complex protein 2 [Strongyloides ratti]CEF65500.1 Elongator complex protein 2 [Strongyloides ratti]
MAFEDIFISGGVCQMPHVLDHDNNGTGVYSSSNNVIFFQKKIEGFYTSNYVYNIHDNDLTCLKFVDNNKKILLSGDKDGTVKINLLENEGKSIYLKEMECFKETKGYAVTFVYGFIENEILYILFSSHQGKTYCYTIQLHYNNWTIIKKQEIVYGKMITLCGAMAYFHEIILALSLSNSTIAILTKNKNGGDFVNKIFLDGHLDWIRDLTFNIFENQLLLASASQDTFVRIWNFELIDKDKMDIVKEENVLKTKEIIFEGQNNSWKVYVETILSGHEGWIYSVKWHPSKLAILTCSIDKFIMIWEPLDDRGVWLEEHRLGEIGGQAVGYYGATFGDNGDEVIANSYYGGLYCWKMNENEDWDSVIMPSGHSAPVTDVDWDPRGNFVITCSNDQTTRIFSIYNNLVIGELSRPQMHGHNRTCLKVLSSDCFISGGEEKIFRVFKAPTTFANSLANILHKNPVELFDNYSNLTDYGAFVPSLGLSNKATNVSDEEMNVDDDRNPVSNVNDAMSSEMAIFSSHPKNLTSLPTEDCLMQNTLWPEKFKLYGHGYEVFAIDSSPDKKLIATACKASHLNFASVYIWDTETWKRKAELTCHQLTVVGIKFSHSGNYLLTCSRDRTWSIFKKENSDGTNWRLLARPEANSKNNHTRIIWYCDWAPNDQYFVTVGRDKKFLIWKFENEIVTFVKSYLHSESITAVAICPLDSSIIAIGLESGKVEVWKFINNDLECIISKKLHGKTVKRLRFPISNKTALNIQSTKPTLASVGDDHLLRITRMSI